jgi:hypothetical protein
VMDAQRCSKCLRDFTGLTETADIGWIVELSSHARLEATFRFIPKQSVLAGLRGSLAAALALRDAAIVDRSSVHRKPIVVVETGACRSRVRVLVQRSWWWRRWWGVLAAEGQGSHRQGFCSK